MPGRIIPPEDKVLEFMDTVDEIMRNNCDALLGVHCTHGLNRTGYMVCRYMRDRLGMSGKVAIKKFEKARGYQIERENYKADLLGDKVPPPQIGVKTDIKPFVEERNVDYHNSRDDDNDNHCDSNRWKYKMRNRSRYFNEGNSSRNERDHTRSRRDSYSGGGRSLSTRRSYDYKYDY